MTFNTDIQKTEKEIAVLQKKLELLKEIEKHKSPVENAYKEWWGQYPELETDSQYDDMRWQGFQAGYEAGQSKAVPPDEPYCPDEPPEYDEVEWDEKDNPKTLLQIIREWCDDDNDPTCEELLNRISGWLPKPQSASGSQNVYVECTVEGFNDCLEKIKRKLR